MESSDVGRRLVTFLVLLHLRSCRLLYTSVAGVGFKFPLCNRPPRGLNWVLIFELALESTILVTETLPYASGVWGSCLNNRRATESHKLSASVVFILLD